MKLFISVLLILSASAALPAKADTLLNCTSSQGRLEVFRENFGYQFKNKNFQERRYEKGNVNRSIADGKPAFGFESDKVKIFHAFGEYRLENKITGQTDHYADKDCISDDFTSVAPLCTKVLALGHAAIALIAKEGRHYLHAYEIENSIIRTDYGVREVFFDNYATYTGPEMQLRLKMYGMMGDFKATYGLERLPVAHLPLGYGDRTVEYKSMRCRG